MIARPCSLGFGLLLLALRAVAAEPGGSKSTAPIAPEFHELILDGVSAGPILAVDGGSARVRVVTAGSGAANASFAPAPNDDLTFESGLPLGAPLNAWAKSFVVGSGGTKAGKIVGYDPIGGTGSNLEFPHSVILGVGLPALDSANLAESYLSFRVAIDRPTPFAGAGSSGSGAVSTQQAWYAANFRLAIDGLDCGQVSRVEPLSFEVAGAMGGNHQAGANTMDMPHLQVTVPLSASQSWRDWYYSTLAKGTYSRKTGVLELLAPNRTTVLLRIKLNQLSLLSLKRDAAPRADRVHADLYIGSVEFDAAPVTIQPPPAYKTTGPGTADSTATVAVGPPAMLAAMPGQPEPPQTGDGAAGTVGATGTGAAGPFGVLPDFYVGESEIVDYDYYTFGYLQGTPRLEGRRTSIGYWLQVGRSMPGALGICKTLAANARQRGGEVLFDNHRNIITVRLTEGGTEAWVEVACDKDRYRVNMIERASAPQAAAAPTAGAVQPFGGVHGQENPTEPVSFLKQGSPPGTVATGTYAIVTGDAASSYGAPALCADVPTLLRQGSRSSTDNAALTAALRRQNAASRAHADIAAGINKAAVAVWTPVDQNTWSCHGQNGPLAQGILVRRSP